MAEPNEWKDRIAGLLRKRREATSMGGEEKLARREAEGKTNARTRIELLVDEESFTEIGQLAGGGVDSYVAGVGMINGRPVAIGSEDFTVAGGSIGRTESAKRYRIVELAIQERIPLVMLLEGAGHRPPLPDDPPSTRTPGDLQAQADASGQVPFAVAVLGPSAGHGALSAPLADFTVMTDTASIFTAGPPLVKASLGEDVTKEDLGGPAVALASGLIHNHATNDEDALTQIRQWLSYLPSSAWQQPPIEEDAEGDRATPELVEMIPSNPRHPYDMAAVIATVMDTGSFFEIQPGFGPSMITGFARLSGQPVAVVANQPQHLAGTINVEAAEKATHFIKVADSFHVPLIFLTDN
ncbi:MAG: carboxyl transferase domain-containing protein, partial [Acidimicrobiales bacterium]|nr:carboxyl transferase domain-containing protein [Acidimicrobiales bacterium]